MVEASNILTERDPDKLEFRLLPEGDKGICNPALGSVQDVLDQQRMHAEVPRDSLDHGVIRHAVDIQPQDTLAGRQVAEGQRLLRWQVPIPQRHQ
mgnify:CR=1 FL=1